MASPNKQDRNRTQATAFDLEVDKAAADFRRELEEATKRAEQRKQAQDRPGWFSRLVRSAH